MQRDPKRAALEVDVCIEHPDGGFLLDVQFSAEPGVTVVFGPSGSGKTTLLAAIAGMSRPTRGRVALGGEVWSDAETKVWVPMEKRRIAFVFQSLALFPHMTGAANVEYGIARDVPREARRTRARASLERFFVGHLAERKPATYSGGEAQRVALARAFAMQPRLVLLDEPFSAMDRRLRQDFVGLVRDFAEALDVVVLHVTHHRGEARALGDRLVLLAGGKVDAVGDPRQLLDRDDAAIQREQEHSRTLAFEDTPHHDRVVGPGARRSQP